jgi:hypothetical protein
VYSLFLEITLLFCWRASPFPFDGYDSPQLLLGILYTSFRGVVVCVVVGCGGGKKKRRRRKRRKKVRT